MCADGAAEVGARKELGDANALPPPPKPPTSFAFATLAPRTAVSYVQPTKATVASVPALGATQSPNAVLSTLLRTAQRSQSTFKLPPMGAPPGPGSALRLGGDLGSARLGADLGSGRFGGDLSSGRFGGDVGSGRFSVPSGPARIGADAGGSRLGANVGFGSPGVGMGPNLGIDVGRPVAANANLNANTNARLTGTEFAVKQGMGLLGAGGLQATPISPLSHSAQSGQLSLGGHVQGIPNNLGAPGVSPGGWNSPVPPLVPPAQHTHTHSALASTQQSGDLLGQRPGGDMLGQRPSGDLVAQRAIGDAFGQRTSGDMGQQRVGRGLSPQQVGVSELKRPMQMTPAMRPISPLVTSNPLSPTFPAEAATKAPKRGKPAS